LNLFRFHPAGSRQGRTLLVERLGAVADTARFRVKRYAGQQAAGCEGGRHTRMRREPLNPDYEPWNVDPEGFAVIAEWLRVIE
jgi:hypothetical protein